MTSKEINDWYKKMLDQIDVKSILISAFRSEYYDRLDKMISGFVPIVPQGGPITEVLRPTPKQLHPGWIIDSQPDANVIEQQISYCKRCNIQNEYIKFNPDWTCYSCRS